ncbi:hypothetical protein KA977_05410 [Candidatus Dependentiae bacterium]|nr:hypothetical protein [Candidatus Dependentiae bacterium]
MLQKIITIILFNILCAYNIFAQNSKIFKIEQYNINEDTILLSDTNIIDFIEGCIGTQLSDFLVEGTHYHIEF